MVKKILAHKLLQNQVFRFTLSAGTGALADFIAFRLLYHNVFQKPNYQIVSLSFSRYTLSLAISFFLGVIINFIMTRYIVFRTSKSRPAKQFVRFISVAIIGFFANWAIVTLFITKFAVDPTVARASAIGLLFFASFFIHKAFSFSLSLRHAA